MNDKKSAIEKLEYFKELLKNGNMVTLLLILEVKSTKIYQVLGNYFVKQVPQKQNNFASSYDWWAYNA